MSKADYNRGFRWGRKAIKTNYTEYGEAGLYASDKAANTCRKYANDKRVLKTAKGKQLTAGLRDYYRGIADGMQDGYNKL